MKIKNYRRFLKDLRCSLFEAIADCENLEWHHKNDGSAEGVHYNRLLTWYEEIEARCAYYDAVQASSGERFPKTIEGAKTG